MVETFYHPMIPVKAKPVLFELHEDILKLCQDVIFI